MTTDAYLFVIVKQKKKVMFKLFPNNNRQKSIGVSRQYNSIEECRKGLEDFRILVKTNNLDEKLSIEEVRSTGHLETKYIPKIVESGKVIFQQEFMYWHKSECKKWIDRIKKHINANVIEE